MKRCLTVLSLLLAARAAALARFSSPPLPEPVRPFAEVETNIVLSAMRSTDNLWKLAIEFESASSNCLEVAFGRDADQSGALDVPECEQCIGCDCGIWFVRDRRTNVLTPLGATGGRVELSFRFEDTARLWNMVRIVSRGAEGAHVVGRAENNALSVRVR